eukprot:Pgem_evm1s11576
MQFSTIFFAAVASATVFSGTATSSPSHHKLFRRGDITKVDCKREFSSTPDQDLSRQEIARDLAFPRSVFKFAGIRNSDTIFNVFDDENQRKILFTALGDGGLKNMLTKVLDNVLSKFVGYKGKFDPTDKVKHLRDIVNHLEQTYIGINGITFTDNVGKKLLADVTALLPVDKAAINALTPTTFDNNLIAMEDLIKAQRKKANDQYNNYIETILKITNGRDAEDISKLLERYPIDFELVELTATIDLIFGKNSGISAKTISDTYARLKTQLEGNDPEEVRKKMKAISDPLELAFKQKLTSLLATGLVNEIKNKPDAEAKEIVNANLDIFQSDSAVQESLKQGASTSALEKIIQTQKQSSISKLSESKSSVQKGVAASSNGNANVICMGLMMMTSVTSYL